MAAERTASWAESLLSFIQRYPGVHLREIRRRLNIPIGTLDYHLYRMGKEGLISVRFQGGYKCCYPGTSEVEKAPIPASEQLLLALLRQPVPRALLLHLYLEGPTSPAALVHSIGTTAPNLSYFLNRLEATGVLVRAGSGSTRVVRLIEPAAVHAVLLKYPPLPETVVDRFLKAWGELHP